MWLSGLSAGLRTKGLLVRFPVRAHAWVVGQVPSTGCVRSTHTLMFLSLSPSFPLSLKINKPEKKKERKPRNNECFLCSLVRKGYNSGSQSVFPEPAVLPLLATCGTCSFGDPLQIHLISTGGGAYQSVLTDRGDSGSAQV